MSHDPEKPANDEPEATPETTTPGDAGAVETPVDALQADLERFRDLALRTQADFENYRKRTTRERDDAIKRARSGLLEDLLPVLDNFELGLQAARAEGSQGVIIGFEMVARQLSEFLSNNGVSVIDAVGQPFDPNLHEALGQEPNPTVPEGHVVRQTRKGYKLGDRLIRPANVYVSLGATEKPLA